MLQTSSHSVAQISIPPLHSLVNSYLAVSSLRPEVLFTQFLPTGYAHTTLDSVPADCVENVILAKMHLGMIITLFDDFADNPRHRNPALLEALYRLNVGQDFSAPAQLRGSDRDSYELARSLFLGLASELQAFPHYQELLPALRFDIMQFYACNRFSELMLLLPGIANLAESRVLGPHNMGIVAAGMIDLMASPATDLAELGTAREILLLGQRLGRISNLVFTYQREQKEGDPTNEISIAGQSPDSYRATLLREFTTKLSEIESRQLKTFSARRYAGGLLALHQLHASLEGRI